MALPLFAGCKGDLCDTLPPAIELHVARGAAEGARSLSVALVIGADRYRRVFDLGAELEDGETSLVVTLDPAPTARFDVELTAEAFTKPGAAGMRLAQATGRLQATPDACNRFTLTLMPAQPDTDAGTADSGIEADGGDSGIEADGGDAAVLADGGDSGIEADGGDAAVPVDAGLDAGVPPPQEAGVADAGSPAPVFPYNPSNFQPAQLQAGPDVVLDCGATVTLDTSLQTVTGWCGTVPILRTLAQPNGPEALLLVMHDLRIAGSTTLQIRGSRPAIFVVEGRAEVAGRIVASAKRELPGPGGSFGAACVGATGSAGAAGAGGNATGGGGGGAGFGDVGHKGGLSGQSDLGGNPGAITGASELVPLRGGCSGGQGGRTGGLGGGGGGAVQISAGGAMDISGSIVTGGGGGAGGPRRAGGGGGGSGGAILLEGATITLGAGSVLAANGGGGGEGGPDNNGVTGASGTDGAQTGGPGGQGAEGGDGGRGQDATVAGNDGSTGTTTRAGGGGGGGAVGRIRLNAQTSCSRSGVVTPMSTSNGASGCP